MITKFSNEVDFNQFNITDKKIIEILREEDIYFSFKEKNNKVEYICVNFAPGGNGIYFQPYFNLYTLLKHFIDINWILIQSDNNQPEMWIKTGYSPA